MRFFTTLLLALLLAGFSSAALAQTYEERVERLSTDKSEKNLARKTFSGKVKSIDGQKAVIRTNEGRDMTVHLGPASFWEQRGYRLRSGMHVEVTGWYESGHSDYYAGSIEGDGFYYELCDNRGYPYWGDRNYYSDWRPCRSHFNFFFGIGLPYYGFGYPARHYHHYDHCYTPRHRHHHHHHWDRDRHHDRGHRDWDRGDRDRDRHRDHDRKHDRRGRR